MAEKLSERMRQDVDNPLFPLYGVVQAWADEVEQLERDRERQRIALTVIRGISQPYGGLQQNSYVMMLSRIKQIADVALAGIDQAIEAQKEKANG